MVCNTSISDHGGPETFGRTIIEAWSYEKPVIAFSVGGPKFIIDNNINGLLINEGDILGLANAINTLNNNNNESLRKKLGESGRTKVKDEFLVDANVLKLKKVLLDIEI
jgi:glycosyltransferase involved in cell wall biosynthesis